MIVDSFTLVLPGDPIGRKEPNIVRRGAFYGMADHKTTANGKRDWLSVWQSAGCPVLREGPILLTLTIVVARPKSHYGTGRNAEVLKASASPYPTTKPDISNILKLVEDALKTRAFRDDSHIVRIDALKTYASINKATGTKAHFMVHP